MKLMKHKLHGYAHAYHDADEKDMKANGWVEAVPANPPADPSLEEQYFAKFGKKPHHRLKVYKTH
jgi:hypothetical protein